jgi:hypothetical protein
MIIIFYFIYCVCANYKCCIMPSRGPDLENKVPGILNLVSCIYIIFQFNISNTFPFNFLSKIDIISIINSMGHNSFWIYQNCDLIFLSQMPAGNVIYIYIYIPTRAEYECPSYQVSGCLKWKLIYRRYVGGVLT